jgi:hypothetical protein
MQIRSGSRRFVLIFKHKVVKIPKFTSWLSFVLGVIENLQERYWWCADGQIAPAEEWYDSDRSTRHLAQIYWADRFGLCVVMERVETLEHLEIPYQECDHPKYLRCKTFLEKEYDGMTFLNDLKPSNIGIRDDGRIVIIDYGYFGCTPQWYLGRKVVYREPCREDT